MLAWLNGVTRSGVPVAMSKLLSAANAFLRRTVGARAME
jgi:hypothetical protein